jgi:chromosome segregation ATPase
METNIPAQILGEYEQAVTAAQAGIAKTVEALARFDQEIEALKSELTEHEQATADLWNSPDQTAHVTRAAEIGVLLQSSSRRRATLERQIHEAETALIAVNYRRMAATSKRLQPLYDAECAAESDLAQQLEIVRKNKQRYHQEITSALGDLRGLAESLRRAGMTDEQINNLSKGQ